jgi:hypothetical protein
MAQCRQGWHLDTEPTIERAKPSEEHKELMAARADLAASYAECKANGDEITCEQLADAVADIDTELRAAGVRGRLTPLDPPPKPVKRSTRRRQDTPNLPLTKSINQATGLGEHTTDAHRDHARRLHAELQITPCSPHCPIWPLYGIQPKGARHSMTPGQCKGKAHQAEHLGIAGRRVLVSRKWSNKTLDDHRAERGEFVRQLLDAAGIQPTHNPADGPYQWERTAPADPDVPPRAVLLLQAIAERQRWKAEYIAAQLAAGEPPDIRSATHDQAA